MEKCTAVSFAEKSAPNALIGGEKRVLDEVIRKTGFVPEKEIFRGEQIYAKGKPLLGSVHYSGTYEGKPAVLKLQGLKVEVSEALMARNFERQNRSKIIHAPKIYRNEEWSAKRGYGFTISELIEGRPIYGTPFATERQMKEFARFYQEYKTRAITRPWVSADPGRIHISTPSRSSTALEAVMKSVERWRSNAEERGRLEFDDYARCLVRFYPLAAEYIPRMKLEFMHGELMAQHVLRMRDGTYRILSNILWRYALEWNDLAKNVWWNLLQIHSNSCTLKEVTAYVEKWLKVYRTIPVVKRDKNFGRKIDFLMLERMIGTIIGDMGSQPYWGSEEGRRHFKHMLGIYQGLFDHFAERLSRY
ncbi:MAG: hypothetical protein M1158_00665 [Candidatus Marsarchaeota archaeon]|nr:hypothetical protein [Candidatus Marsarchaeota archaeon]